VSFRQLILYAVTDKAVNIISNPPIVFFVEDFYEFQTHTHAGGQGIGIRVWGIGFLGGCVEVGR
jgi:hypothetical protein